MFEELEEYLKDVGFFNKEIHPIILEGMNVITGDVPKDLKLSIILSELITITSHLKKHILLEEGTVVPCNGYILSLASSGFSKDRSMNAIRKQLLKSYEYLEEVMREEAREKAELKAKKETGKDGNWIKFYKPPPPLIVGLGTSEGLVKHFKSLESYKYGAGSITVTEVGTEISGNASFMDIMKTLAIGFDLGKIPSKILKDSDNTTESINLLPINALLFGSEDAILFDKDVKDKVQLLMRTQMARRLIFSFCTEKPKTTRYNSIEDIVESKKKGRSKATKSASKLSSLLLDVVKNTSSDPLTLTEDAQALYDIYEEYNLMKSDKIDKRFTMSALSRRHKQWLALKLSGNIAILEKSETITDEHFIYAVNIIEYFAEDLLAFEVELSKDTYEQFADYCAFMYDHEEGSFNINVHELKKLGYIKDVKNYRQQLEALVDFVSKYDEEGLYSLTENGITYSKYIKKDEIPLSYIYYENVENMDIDRAKEYMAKNSHKGFESVVMEFSELPEVLKSFTAYTPFKFKDGKRNNKNLEGTTNWLALDVDHSTITYDECSFLLNCYNHHIATTSDKSNKFKFRVLLELNTTIDVSSEHWRDFIKYVGEDLGLILDPLPKSGILFSYGEDTEVISCLDGEKYDPKEALVNATKQKKTKSKPIPKEEMKRLLTNKRDTFDYAYDADKGKGGISLVKAAFHAQKLGASFEEVKELLIDINNYWVDPMEEHRFNVTILNYIERVFNI